MIYADLTTSMHLRLSTRARCLSFARHDAKGLVGTICPQAGAMQLCRYLVNENPELALFAGYCRQGNVFRSHQASQGSRRVLLCVDVLGPPTPSAFLTGGVSRSSTGEPTAAAGRAQREGHESELSAPYRTRLALLPSLACPLMVSIKSR
jgi:hypothetical protein